MSKLDSLVHYVCARCENPTQLGATKLNKILWYSDVLSYAQDGSSITNAVYVKRQFGPVPKGIMGARHRLKLAGAVIERDSIYHGYQQTQFIALKRPDISMFTAEQINLVDMVLHSICFDHTAASISNTSHDLVWESAQIGEEIPMAAAAFAGDVGEINEDDMIWANAEIDRIEKEIALSA